LRKAPSIPMLALASASVAFTAPGAALAPTMLRSASAPLAPTMVEKSSALPFLKQPPALDGSMAGDAGFDPLGFSTTVTSLGGDLSYVREAELMHGRQSMLAVVGMIFPATFFHAPWADSLALTKPLEVQYQLPAEVTAQLFVSMAIAEGIRAKIIFGGEAEVGEHLDATTKARLIKAFKLETPEAMAAMKTKEIKHCRLAMIAFIGMVAAEVTTGKLPPFL